MKLWKVAVTDARSTSIYVFLVFARAILSAARVLIAKMLPRSPRHTATESCSSQSCRKGSFKKGKAGVMNFQNLGKVETFQKYLDMAYNNGLAQAESVRKDTTNPNRLFRSKRIEQARVEAVGKSLANSLGTVGKSFPRFDALAPFYQELVRCTVEYDQLKKSLGALNWAKHRSEERRV